jgi:hypothetical protein
MPAGSRRRMHCEELYERTKILLDREGSVPLGFGDRFWAKNKRKRKLACNDDSASEPLPRVGRTLPCSNCTEPVRKRFGTRHSVPASAAHTL